MSKTIGNAVNSKTALIDHSDIWEVMRELLKII